MPRAGPGRAAAPSVLAAVTIILASAADSTPAWSAEEAAAGETDSWGFDADESDGTVGDESSADDYGFDDEDDWGFEEDADSGSEASSEDPGPATSARFWELNGDLSLGASYNFISHNAEAGPNRQPDELGTHWGNLSRMRAQLNLQLDLFLPAEWKMRVEGYGFYDFVYLLKGRSSYTNDVLDDYEWEVDFLEVWIQGSPTKSLDVKLGRQIVNWGRSDTLRVLDVLNPLDNREPGVVDIENLRLPVTMARVDYFPKWIPREFGRWNLQLLVVPEFRQDRNPPIGNDFNPTPLLIDPPSDKPDPFFDDPEYGGALTGSFSGWDLSFYAARVYLNQPLLAEPLGGAIQRHPLVTLLGAGGNLTFGSWLLKGEIGWFQDVEYNRIDVSVFPPDGDVVDKDRLDWMAGVEYYGVSDLTVAFEVVNRHIFRFDQRMKSTFQGVKVAFAKRHVVESALRATADFLNSRLRVTALGVVLGTRADLGSIARLEAAYDLRDALVLTGGIILYQKGRTPGFDKVGDNDRFFVRLEYSF